MPRLVTVLAIVVLALALLWTAGQRLATTPEPARPFPDSLDWIGTERPLSLEDLRGKVVLLDFLTFGCINCLHVIPDLKELEERHPDELVVIGVHSAKFEHERGTEAIRAFARRYGILHPMVNDHRFEIWDAYGIRAWPSFVLIDPEGEVAGRHVGEGVLAALGDRIDALIMEHDRRGTLDRRPIPGLAPDVVARAEPDTVLSFPGGIALEPRSGLLAVADTAGNRVVVARVTPHTAGGALAPGEEPVADVIFLAGDGVPGLRDGDAASARFQRPHGLAWDGPDRLYVADTGNHAVRRIDLAAGTVETVAGTGRQTYMHRAGPAGPDGLNSPWDVAVIGGRLATAMAGQHQLWTIDPDDGALELLAGSGREVLADGPRRNAGLNQPSGLARFGDLLFVADAEASAVREVDLRPGGEVRTLVGVGLFDFGNVDGVGDDVRLQHPKAVAIDPRPPADVHPSTVWIADTYNHAIKRLDPTTREVRTVFAGADGGVRLDEPGALAVAGGIAWIADTNGHAVRVLDLAEGRLATLSLRDPTGILARAADDGPFLGERVRAPDATVAPGPGTLDLAVELPSGYVRNDLAPLTVRIRTSGPAVRVAPGEADREIEGASFPLELSVPATFAEGAATVEADLTTYYCREGAEAICLIDRVRIETRVTVDAGDDAGREPDGRSTVRLEHRAPPLVTVR